MFMIMMMIMRDILTLLTFISFHVLEMAKQCNSIKIAFLGN